MAKDPVCGMDVNESTAQYKTEYKGKTYYFCCSECQTAFERDPTQYIGFEHHGCCS